MKRAIGFRAEPDAVNWAVVEGTIEAPVLVASDRAVAPKAYDEGEALCWYRDRIFQLIEQYSPSVAAIRYPETSARAAVTESARRRTRVEGVLLESASSKALRVKTGPLGSISKRLGSNSAKFYLERDDLRRLDWSSAI